MVRVALLCASPDPRALHAEGEGFASQAWPREVELAHQQAKKPLHDRSPEALVTHLRPLVAISCKRGPPQSPVRTEDNG